MQVENASYKEEITTLKKDINSTKLSEMEVEVSFLTQECTRLRNKIEKLLKKNKSAKELKALEEAVANKDNLITKLKTKNE